jgi:plastocyanin
MVGGDAGLVYTPNQVTAAVGDVVHFVMLAKNHTVTQSTFANPCVKMAGGQDSGFLPNAGVSAAQAPTFQVTVASTDPTWWYCKQKVGTHCGKGMVFAINPTAEKSFEAFQSMAIAQNGTGAAASTTAAAAASGTVTLTVDNGNSMAATTTAAGAIATTTSIAAGWNNAGNAQACNCACFCGVAAFPVGAGLGAFGGFSGSLPAPWSA